MAANVALAEIIQKVIVPNQIKLQIEERPYQFTEKKVLDGSEL